MSRRLAMLLLLLSSTACESKGSAPAAKPTGTTADPVDVCERLADVCKLDGSRLGVCTAPASGKGFICMSQH